jgi:hypothetical protein
MTIELDDLDKDFLARSHTPDEWRRELKDALERNALYFRRILELMDQVTALKAAIDMMPKPSSGCGYPACLEDNRCARMWAGECAGPRA